MQGNNFIALLDSSVLAPMPVADTLLRLSEERCFYLPRWSNQILDELHRTLRGGFGYSAEQAARRVRVMREDFPESIVTGYEELIPAMNNHVLAAAVRCGAQVIVSDDKRHFPAGVLAQYSMECLTSGEFLEHQYHLDRDAFISIIVSQAADIRKPLGWVLTRLPKSVADLIKP